MKTDYNKQATEFLTTNNTTLEVKEAENARDKQADVIPSKYGY